jgi:hypothetical protein
MNSIEKDLKGKLSDDELIRLCQRHGGKRFPGQKCIRRLKRERFLKDVGGETASKSAKDIGVSIQTIYNWQKERIRMAKSSRGRN